MFSQPRGVVEETTKYGSNSSIGQREHRVQQTILALRQREEQL